MNMAQPETTHWFLQEWFGTQGLKQRDLVTKLDYLPAKAHKIWHGIQVARLTEVAEIADLLNIAPHELLMHPDDAMRIRRLQAVLAEVAPAATTQEPSEAHSDAPIRRKAS